MDFNHRFSSVVNGMEGGWRSTEVISWWSNGHFPDLSDGRMDNTLSEKAVSNTICCNSLSVAFPLAARVKMAATVL